MASFYEVRARDYARSVQNWQIDSVITCPGLASEVQEISDRAEPDPTVQDRILHCPY